MNLSRPSENEFRTFRELKARNKESSDPEIQREINKMEMSLDMAVEIISENGKHGLKNAIGEIILEPAFDQLKMLPFESLDTGDLVVAKHSGKWGILRIDGKGRWIWKPAFDDVGYPDEFAFVQKGNKWGVIHVLKHEYLLPVEFDHVSKFLGFMFNDGLAFYGKDNKIGVITEKGEYTDVIFDDVKKNDEKELNILYNGQWGYVDIKGSYTKLKEESYYTFK
jgi:hypothetical protein